jgi:hypothetical protein
MQFRTELTPESLPQPLQLTDRIVTLGSCFADQMGRRLADHKLAVLNNPFGTIFNPVSLAKLVTMALRETPPDEDLYVERDGVWFHYDFHSSLRADSRAELEALLIQTLTDTGDALRRADWLFLTLGTAVVYRHIETGQVVANCHKQPGRLFEKYLYQIDHAREMMQRLVRTLRRANPTVRVLLTVSPVRHIKDTLPINDVSKATLRVVAHELTVWHDWIQYFPACELMQDDLRDYRFYEADLIHPNGQALDYIWAKFTETACSPDLRAFIAEWNQVRQAIDHRPFNPNSAAHRQFLTNLLTRLDRLALRTDVSAELAMVRGRLTEYVRL